MIEIGNWVLITGCTNVAESNFANQQFTVIDPSSATTTYLINQNIMDPSNVADINSKRKFYKINYND